ncbi:DUF2795 domain-containing protein [Nocardia camponoti]|uniref:DUF2795 domain-containing protein n=1 Tax=Nocardia camponoti TaxID=1616106 RepID=A0A917Q7A4_9NOCA|nr:DUF2795 domain-containing protein [Nocardia camponoti]GGK32951.1 hypothetical protein GCM10011591_00780 [Nocardia camponoti]
MAGQTNPIQIEKYLGGVNYPVGRDVLVATAKKHSAPPAVIKVLEELPASETFDGPVQVSEATGPLT